ncbi:MAG: sigma-54 interaction domain-containing protein [bacterium]|jgi:transcriptional regulator with PAS, ATPase and Fis domain
MLELGAIEDTVQQVAEAIAAVLELDVSIIDRRYVRLGATGLYAGVRFSSAARNSLFDEIMQTGEPGYIGDSRDSELCRRCQARSFCQELATLGQPIFCRGQVVGVIGVVAFTADQRQRLKEQSEQLLNFLSRMANLLGSKLLLTEALQEEERRNREFKENHISSSSHSPITLTDIIGQAASLNRAKAVAAKVAPSPSTVLIRGESGTGKEMFARSIHSASLRAENPFVAVNCASIPESLLESELFGYDSGAFTGARRGGKMGKFELAQGGTLFLDEIGDLPLHLQPKLLRVLQERRIERVGGTKSIPIDVRIIAATHHNLEELIANGSFRRDLYYRLNVIPLVIPPLRRREGDVTVLSKFFITKYCHLLQRPSKELTLSALALLRQHPWPGNVRELENAIEYAVNMATGPVITPAELPPYLRGEKTNGVNGAFADIPAPEALTEATLQELLDTYESQILEYYLTTYGTSSEAKAKIAQRLGISLATLYRRLAKHKSL